MIKGMVYYCYTNIIKLAFYLSARPHTDKYILNEYGWMHTCIDAYMHAWADCLAGGQQSQGKLSIDEFSSAARMARRRPYQTMGFCIGFTIKPTGISL